MVDYYTYLELYIDDIRKSVSLSEFEKHFQIPHQTVKVHLSSLVKKRILLEEKKPRLRVYSLNREHPLLKEYLSIMEKERLIAFLEKNALFSRLHMSLTPYFSSNKILLFGSAVEKKDFSDIDILILSKDKTVHVALKNISATYTVKFHIIQTDESHLTNVFLQEVRKKHIFLNNHDYFIELLYEHDLKIT